MKINSQQTGSGKLGNVVYSQNAGVCIARQYKAEVANPSTEAQVDKRSAFKLLSQLSAAVKQDIAIRKNGLQSARNQFMSVNYQAVSVEAGDATINLNRVQLTKSNRGIGEFEADRTSGTGIAVNMAGDEAVNVDKVVYAAYVKQVDGSLMPFDSIVVSEAGEGGTFPATLKFTDLPVVVLSYGVKTNTSGARAAFGNMKAPTAEQVARLITTSSEAANGSSVTRTKGLTLNAGESSASSDDVERFLVSVSASGNGSVSGGGRYAAGEVARLVATPVAEATFVAWRKGSRDGQTLSTNANYQFEVTADITIVGVFQGGPTPQYVINASASPAGDGSVTGAGTKAEGSTCTLVATPIEGKAFLNWTENGQVVSTSASYSFTVQRARTLVAHFGEQPASGFANVTFDGSAWNGDKSGVIGTKTFAGSFGGDSSVNQIGLIMQDSSSRVKPTIGSTPYPEITARLDGGNFTLSTNIQMSKSYWLVAIHTDEDLDDIMDVYPYFVAGADAE